MPNSVMNLDLDLRESSRGSSILSRPILTIWGDLRSMIPGALARSKFQVADRVGYNLFSGHGEEVMQEVYYT